MNYSTKAHCGEDDGVPYVVVDEVPTTFAEKPFVTIDGTGLYFLTVPAAQPAGRVGADWETSAASSSASNNINATSKPTTATTSTTTTSTSSSGADLKIPFDQVYVADNTTDTAASINAKLSQGLHLVLSPGIYNLDAALELNFENQVVHVTAAVGEKVVKVEGVIVAVVVVLAAT